MATENSLVERMMALAHKVMPEAFEDDNEIEDFAMSTRISVIESISNVISNRLMSFLGIELPDVLKDSIGIGDGGCGSDGCEHNINGVCIKGTKGGDA